MGNNSTKETRKSLIKSEQSSSPESRRRVWLTPLDAEGNPEGEALELEVENVEIVFDWEPSEVDKLQASKRLVRMIHSEEFEDGSYVQYFMPCATVEEDMLKRLGEKFLELTLGPDGDTILT